MNKLLILLTAACCCYSAKAQTDTTAKTTPDTLHVGNLLIIKKDKEAQESSDAAENGGGNRHRFKPISTNWIIVDLGFTNFHDQTNYSDAIAAGVVAPGTSKEQFNLRNGKSLQVNIWLFMQRLSLVQRVVNIKYGLGIQLNNYRFETPLVYDKNNHLFATDPVRHYKKDKLAADYVTVPLMLNFNFTPHNGNNNSFGFSAGISAGYLYASRMKMITAENGKQKIRDNMYLRPFKINYIAELQLGPVKLYGSLATESIFEKGLDQIPYAIGLRFSNW